MDSRFTYNPNFRVDSLPQQPKSPGIPHGIREILPAGQLVDDSDNSEDEVHSSGFEWEVSRGVFTHPQVSKFRGWHP